MKYRAGFLLCENKATKKMIPYFVKVRSEDIVATDPVPIGDVLQQTSMRWDLMRMVDDADKTYYYFKQKYESPEEDKYGEFIPSNYLDASICYEFHKGGMLTVSGTFRTDGLLDAASSIDAMKALVYEKTIHLPYALPVDNPMGYNISAEYAYGDIHLMSFGATVKTAQITSNGINYGLEDTKQYPFVLKLIQARKTEEGYNPLAEFKNSMDTGYTSVDVTTYGAKYIPIRFEFKGFWADWSK